MEKGVNSSLPTEKKDESETVVETKDEGTEEKLLPKTSKVGDDGARKASVRPNVSTNQLARLSIEYRDLLEEHRNALKKYESIHRKMEDYILGNSDVDLSKLYKSQPQRSENPNTEMKAKRRLSRKLTSPKFAKELLPMEEAIKSDRDARIALSNNPSSKTQERGKERRNSIHGVAVSGQKVRSNSAAKITPIISDPPPQSPTNAEKLKLRIESGYRMIIDDDIDDETESTSGSPRNDSGELSIIPMHTNSSTTAPASTTKVSPNPITNPSHPNSKTTGTMVTSSGRRTMVKRRGSRRASKDIRKIQQRKSNNRIYRFFADLPVIHPESKFRANWNLLILCMLLWYCFTIPFSISYSLPPYGAWLVIEIVFDCLFGIDILLNTHTGYYSSKQAVNLIVMNKKMILANYVTSWLIVDLVSIVPFDRIILSAVDTGDSAVEQRSIASFSKLIRLLKLFRLLRLAGMWRYFRYWSERLKPGMLRLMSSVLVNLLVIHVLACLFFFISDLDPNQVDTWSNVYGIRESSVLEQYVVSLYWSITTMTTVGYGDIIPQTTGEVAYVIFAMMISCSMFAYFVGNMAHIIASVDSTQTLYKEKMEFVREYMSHQDLPEELQVRIKAYYSHCWKNLKSFPFSEVAILDDLSPALRREVVLYLNKYMVEKVPFFQNQDENFICKLILVMVSEICAPLDFIIRQGEVGKCMYFIRRGLVEVCNADASEIYTTLSDGAYFGEVSLLVGGRRTASVRAIFHCSLLRLEQEDLDEILIDYPDAMSHIVKLAATSKYQLTEAERMSLQTRFEVFNKKINGGGVAAAAYESEGGDDDEDDDNDSATVSITSERTSSLLDAGGKRKHAPLGAHLFGGDQTKDGSTSSGRASSSRREASLRRSKTMKLSF